MRKPRAIPRLARAYGVLPLLALHPALGRLRRETAMPQQPAPAPPQALPRATHVRPEALGVAVARRDLRAPQAPEPLDQSAARSASLSEGLASLVTGAWLPLAQALTAQAALAMVTALGAPAGWAAAQTLGFDLQGVAGRAWAQKPNAGPKVWAGPEAASEQGQSRPPESAGFARQGPAGSKSSRNPSPVPTAPPRATAAPAPSPAPGTRHD